MKLEPKMTPHHLAVIVDLMIREHGRWSLAWMKDYYDENVSASWALSTASPPAHCIIRVYWKPTKLDSDGFPLESAVEKDLALLWRDGVIDKYDPALGALAGAHLLPKLVRNTPALYHCGIIE